MRAVTRLLAVVLALVLFLGGLLMAAEIVLAQLDRPSWLVPRDEWGSWLRTQTWDTRAVRSTLVLVGIVGLLLLFAALRRGRPAGLALRTESAPPGVRTTASRQGIEKTLESAAREVDSVTSARAFVSRRRATVNATTTTRGDDPKQHVREAVTRRLADLGLDRSLRLRVTTTYQEP